MSHGKQFTLYIHKAGVKNGRLRLSDPNDKICLSLSPWFLIPDVDEVSRTAVAVLPSVGTRSLLQSSNALSLQPPRPRYLDEVKRVVSIMESVLSKQEWLVGGKFVLADLAFLLGMTTPALSPWPPVLKVLGMSSYIDKSRFQGRVEGPRPVNAK
ncbi:hypothetical protein OE88DRAFT_1646236 [Heliocybe sulcata]|uniref:Glutathione S-transferase C-terminal domain-containing protein n=1 Tax=Heliocybe sulcata TaxID=5364 RepID=A0A5C3MXD5_9AGAM|nr:hypothetical protein OE88DRAFT_1646236 [Heliocybe sulcata]